MLTAHKTHKEMPASAGWQDCCDKHQQVEGTQNSMKLHSRQDHYFACSCLRELTCIGIMPKETKIWLAQLFSLTSHSRTRHSPKNSMTSMRSLNCSTKLVGSVPKIRVWCSFAGVSVKYGCHDVIVARGLNNNSCIRWLQFLPKL